MVARVGYGDLGALLPSEGSFQNPEAYKQVLQAEGVARGQYLSEMDRTYAAIEAEKEMQERALETQERGQNLQYGAAMKGIGSRERMFGEEMGQRREEFDWTKEAFGKELDWKSREAELDRALSREIADLEADLEREGLEAQKEYWRGQLQLGQRELNERQREFNQQLAWERQRFGQETQLTRWLKEQDKAMFVEELGFRKQQWKEEQELQKYLQSQMISSQEKMQRLGFKHEKELQEFQHDHEKYLQAKEIKSKEEMQQLGFEHEREMQQFIADHERQLANMGFRHEERMFEKELAAQREYWQQQLEMQREALAGQYPWTSSDEGYKEEAWDWFEMMHGGSGAGGIPGAEIGFPEHATYGVLDTGWGD